MLVFSLPKILLPLGLALPLPLGVTPVYVGAIVADLNNAVNACDGNGES